MDSLIDNEIKGYKLRERIGAGGFGAVYRAFQSTVGREVAIKFILPGFSNQPDFIRRFETEAQLVARLEHPHITPLYDYWRDPDGAYLVMRWLRGGSLREALQNGAFDVRSAALLLDQIASALSLAHRNGVIHRDLKPGNILLDEDGNAYLADFGIAKDLKVEGGHTQPDAIVGSMDYISPEQARSEPVTPRTDIYSLGVVLFEVLAGHHPFENISVIERLYKHISDPLPELTSLDASIASSVNKVIQKATAKNPEQRYSDPLTMAVDFREAAGLNRTPTGQIVEALLTQREHEILRLIIDGRSNKEIAAQLTLTLSTVKWYVNQIFTKLHVRSRVQAIIRARELNLIGGANSVVQPASNISNLPEPENPYKGLLAFQPGDAQDFFGRDELTQKLVRRMESGSASTSNGATHPSDDSAFARFLAVVGPSGSGKSSLVKAGLIPALWRGELPGSEKWFVVDMLPGAHPLDKLEVALMKVAANQSGSLNEQLARDKRGLLRAADLILPNDGSELVVAIDQFEEVFTLVEDEAERQHFLDLIVTAVRDLRSRVRVVITLRADFYDRPLIYPEFGELVRSRMETVMPLSAKGLERAIAGPAERVGVRFEPGLVAALVAEMNYQAGALPLLQYALTELFERREGRTLTHKAYQEIGGAVGALAKRAEELYLDLTPEGQEIARQIFMRLVTLGEGVEDTRRRAARSELLAVTPESEVTDEIIDTYANYRLLSLDNDPANHSPTVELAHEAILREWERLRKWINDSREEIRMQQQLAHLTEEWMNAGKDNSYLVSGLRLEQFEKWPKSAVVALTPDERAYLDASIAQRDREQTAEREQQARVKALENRSVRFLRALVAVFLVAALLGFGLTGVAVTKANEAQTERVRAESQARISQERELVGYTTSNLSNDAELSSLLALQAVNTTYAVDGSVLPEAETVLHQAVQELRTPFHLKATSYSPGSSLSFFFMSDGERIVYPKKITADFKGELTAVADAITGQELYTVDGELANGHSLNDHVLTLNGTENGFVILEWDISSLQSGKLLKSIDVPFIPVLEGWEASLDLKHFVSFSATQGTQMWDITSGTAEEVTTLPDAVNANRFNGFSADGTRFAFLNADGGISFLDTSNWQELFSLAPAGTDVLTNLGPYATFLLTQDGNSLITVNTNDTLSLWDLATRTEQFVFSPPFHTQNMSVSDDGTRLAAGTQAGETIIWDTTTGEELLTLPLSSNQSFSFSPDNARLGTLNSDGDLKIWPLIPEQELATFTVSEVNEDAGPASLVYSPDGSRLVTASVSETPMVWDAQTGQQVFALSGHTARVWAADWSSDGKLIATGGTDAEVKLWDATTGGEVRTLSGHEDNVYGVAFSPDSALLASSSYDGTVRIWNVTSGELMLTLDQPAASKGVDWSPDGKRVAAVTNQDDNANSHLRIWDTLTGEQQLDVALGNSRCGTVVFNPDGTRITIGMQEAHLAYVFDAQTGQKLLTLTGHLSNVPGVAYSRDGSRIATAGLNVDMRVIIWDATTGAQLLTLYNPSAGVLRSAFSPDGKHLAALSQDGVARIYTLDINDLVGLAQSRLTRWWAEDECRKYLHADTCPAQT